jgi:hypothetical protein
MTLPIPLLSGSWSLVALNNHNKIPEEIEYHYINSRNRTIKGVVHARSTININNMHLSTGFVAYLNKIQGVSEISRG